MKEDYVTAVGDTETLTKGPLASWWRDVVSKVRTDFRGGSTQGYYVFASDGTPVAWDNYQPRIGEFVARAHGMAKAKTTGAAAKISGDDIAKAKLFEAPEGTSIIRLFTRIRPIPEGASEMNANIGRDYMWITEDEVRAIAAASKSEGKSFSLPDTVIARITVFHMVDNVRQGQWPYRPDSVKKAKIEGKTIKTAGDIRTIAISGEYSKRDSHPPQWSDRGQEGTFEGEMDIDLSRALITRFRVLARSTGWSDASYDLASIPPKGKYPLLTAMVEAMDPVAKKVPPSQAVMNTDWYLRLSLTQRW